MNHPGYSPTQWQGTLLYWAIMGLAIAVNLFSSNLFLRNLLGRPGNALRLTLIPQGTDCAVHVSLLLSHAACPLAAPHLACCLTDVCRPQMAEEIRGANYVIPWCVVATSVLNGILGLGTLLAMLYVTVDIDAVLLSPTGKLGFPFMQVVLDSVGSYAGATVMISIVIAMFVFAVMAFLATASRIVFAFGRDKGLPFWQTMAKARLFSTIISST
ncbi:MAG: hypothetical protein Q9218_004035 [Villophora microphyllina]